MEPLTLLLFIGCFVLFVVISCFFMNGIFLITRGHTEERPDGQLVDKDDMIFYGLYKFIMHEKKPPLRVYYRGKALSDFMQRLTSKISLLPKPDLVDPEGVYYHQSPGGIIPLYQTVSVRDYLEENDMQMDYVPVDGAMDTTIPPRDQMPIMPGSKSHTIIYFYALQKRYRFPKIVRKPVVECLKCYPSFWGTLLYWPAVLFVFGSFSGWMVPVWLVYLISCSYVNYLLFTRTL